MKLTSYKTGCGGSIFLSKSACDHLKTHPGILNLIPEIVSMVLLPRDGSRLVSQISLGKVVGESSLIKTPEIGLSETAWFAVRKNRMKASRVVPDAGPADTDLVSIVAKPVEKTSYELVTAWFGAIAPKEPWDIDLADDLVAYEESINFWCSYALVYNEELMGEPFRSNWNNILE